MTAAAMSPEEQLVEDIASFTYDPLGYALYAFPWGRRARSWRTQQGQETGNAGCSILLVSTLETQLHGINR